MFSISLRSIYFKYRLVNEKNAFRYVRSIARREDGPKVIQGKVKTVTEYDELERIQTYKDLVKSVQKSNLGDELEIEQNFLNEDYHGHVFENSDKYYAMHSREEKGLNSLIKKKIIGRKYFKLDRETNLLSHAAKQQIRFLHNSNPLEWNYKALAECFPISEAGVKKLLKCNFVLTCPERIKAHDEDVARKWEILKSNKISDEISILTQKLYKEGKLVDDYFSGNPKLPTAPPPSKKIIKLQKNKPIGEFSDIVKTYHDYKEKKLLGSNENAEKQVSVIDNNRIGNGRKKNSIIKNVSKFKVASEEYEGDTDPEVYPNFKKKIMNNNEIPFSQFKEILKEENDAKLKSKYKNEHDSFVQKQISMTDENIVSQNPEQSHGYFTKIPKYEKKNVDLMFEKDKTIPKIYKYDEKLGYQYPAGKIIRGRINITSKQNKERKLIKVGKCIYDEDGEFLCRVPT